jgi:hypothetical protein
MLPNDGRMTRHILDKALEIMRNTCSLLIVLSLGGANSRGQNPVYELTARRQTATVTIMAISAAVHHPAYGGNLDVYLADIEFKGEPKQLAVLMDTYPRDGLPIRRPILTELHVLQMTLTRDSTCDTTSQRLFIPADDSNIFAEGTRNTLKEMATGKLPCFSVIHDSTRLSK